MSYEITLSIEEKSPQGYNIETLAGIEHLSREEAALKLLAQSSVSPLTRALAMVEARDGRTSQITPRIQGVNDAATEIRQMREAQTP